MKKLMLLALLAGAVVPSAFGFLGWGRGCCNSCYSYYDYGYCGSCYYC